MRKHLIAIVFLVSAVTAGATGTAPRNGLTGDYVEARTASVFAGACHFNGEVTTTGRNAVLAWRVRTGAWSGVRLDGLTAMVAVRCSANLKDTSARRDSVLYIDARATNAQAAALKAAIGHNYQAALGDIVTVRRVPIVFHRDGESFTVDAGRYGRMDVAAMPNHECCKQPNLVWYDPLVAVTGRRVGYTRDGEVHDGALGASWLVRDANTAFYGEFTL